MEILSLAITLQVLVKLTKQHGHSHGGVLCHMQASRTMGHCAPNLQDLLETCKEPWFTKTEKEPRIEKLLRTVLTVINDPKGQSVVGGLQRLWGYCADQQIEDTVTTTGRDACSSERL